MAKQQKYFGVTEGLIESVTKVLNEGIPLEGHPYHKKSNAELHYIMKDAGEAARAMKNVDPKAEAKYLDQVNDASTVMHYRRKASEKTVAKMKSIGRTGDMHEEEVQPDASAEQLAEETVHGEIKYFPTRAGEGSEHIDPHLKETNKTLTTKLKGNSSTVGSMKAHQERRNALGVWGHIHKKLEGAGYKLVDNSKSHTIAANNQSHGTYEKDDHVIHMKHDGEGNMEIKSYRKGSKQ